MLAGLAAVTLLSGCDLRQRFASAEDRINAEFPLSVEARQAHERLVELLAGQSAERAALDSNWEARLRARALSCSPDFTPTWKQSSEDIRAAVKDKACLAESDRKLSRWASLQRVRLMLAQPPLAGDGSGNVPASLTLRGPGLFLSPEAGEAPVLALTTVEGFELIALSSGRSLFQERGTQHVVSMAANGRLFAQATLGVVRLRVSDGGETLLEMPDTRAVQWLGKQFVLVRSYSAKPSYLLNLRTGEEVALPVDAVSSSVRLLPVPGADQRFNLLTTRGIYQFEIGELDGKTQVSLVGEKPGFDPRMALVDSGQLSSDGKEWVFGQRKLFRFDLQTLELREQSFEPALVAGAWPTTNPEQFVVSLNVRGPGGGAVSLNGNYLFDSSNGTLARVEGAAAQRPMRYFASIKRLAQIDYPMLRLPERVETAAAQPVDQAIGTLLDEANQQVLAQAAVEAQWIAQSAALAPDSPLFAQMRDAQIEGIGIYEGREKVTLPGQFRAMGKVLVTVRRSPRPVVLVLSAYEPVQWSIKLEPGARLATVLLCGYYESSVQGASDTRVLRIGREYAHQSEGPEYQALQRQVMRWTGKPIAVFQTGYYGANFSVGGS